jgi:hypothetical protein
MPRELPHNDRIRRPRVLHIDVTGLLGALHSGEGFRVHCAQLEFWIRIKRRRQRDEADKALEEAKKKYEEARVSSLKKGVFRAAEEIRRRVQHRGDFSS